LTTLELKQYNKNKKINIMAELDSRYDDNMAGKYFVDEECIDCDACREIAPRNFKRNQEEGYSYVYKQTEDSQEEEECKTAMEGCPVDAIGDFGDSGECCGLSCGCHEK
jgi:ferredoxin